MKTTIEARFAAVFDRRLQRHNDRLWENLLAWSEVLSALGWCVAVKDAALDALRLNPHAVSALGDTPSTAGSWRALAVFLDGHPALLRPVASESIQVWARSGQLTGGADTRLSALTKREREVLTWLREGKTGPEVALILDCAPRTVESHVAKIYRKLGILTRTGLLIQPHQPL